MQVAHAGKRFQEDVMVGRIVGDHDRAGYGSGAVGMGLKRRVPEVFRKMMLTHRKAHIRRGQIMSKSQRERELDRGSGGFCPLAGEIVHPGIPYSGFLERMRIEGGVAAVEDQHRETLTLGEKVAMI